MAKKSASRTSPHPTAADLAFEPATEKDVRVRVFPDHTSVIWRVAMPSDGRFALTSSSDGTVRRWQLNETKDASEIVYEGPPFIGLALTQDGSRTAVGDCEGFIHLIELGTAQSVTRWKGHDTGALSTENVGNLAFIDQGLLSVAREGYLRNWDVQRKQTLALYERRWGDLYGVAASSDGKRIVGAIEGKGLVYWSGIAGAAPLLLKEDISNQAPVAVPANAVFAFTGTMDGKVTQWSLSRGRRVAAFEGHSGPVRSLAVTLDGRFCVSGGTDNTVRLWSVKTGQCLAILHGHTGLINGVSISFDARRVASVSIDRTLRVWDIPQSMLDRTFSSRRRGYMNAKVVLLGDSGVGKSGLALRLWHDRWEKTESTHGMEIQRLTLPPTPDQEEGVEREVWLWDLAGQPDYRLTHQLFMEQTALALLVFDPQDDRLFETVGYWQRAMAKVTRSGQVIGILVAARCDRPGLRLSEEEVRAWADARGLHGPIITAAKLKTHAGAAQLRDLIANLLPWDTMEFRSTMQNFPPLKDTILAVRDAKGAGGVVVTPAELETRVRVKAPKLDFTGEDLRAVTGLLAGEGVLHRLPYGDLIVLQPSWINCYASILVKLAGEAENQLGHVSLSRIRPGALPADDETPRLTTEDERQLLPALVGLFLERALAWKQDTDKGPMLVFPNYARLPRPHPPERPGRTVLYRFTGPLEEIYCTLVVRLHYSGLFKRTKLYRQAADFLTATGKLAALTMREEGERGELEIYFGKDLDGDVQAPFQRFVHEHLLSKASHLERLRNYFCPKCHEEVTDRRVIDNALAKGRKKVVCAYCEPEAPGQIELHDVLEEQFSSKAGEAGADAANRKANEEITEASKEGIMVGEVQTIVFNADQIYRSITEPDEGVDGEIEFRYSGTKRKDKKASGIAYRVQLKSGDSNLRPRKDGTEVFPMKPHYADHWAGKGTVPVLLIIRTSEGRLRYMNATDAIHAAQKANPGKPVKQIVFTGEDFTREAVLQLREMRLSTR